MGLKLRRWALWGALAALGAGCGEEASAPSPPPDEVENNGAPVACEDGGDHCGEGDCVEGRCVIPCSPGSEGCACGDGGACEGDLVCMEGLCAEPGCSPGAEGCPCEAAGDGARCAEGLTCGEDGVCAPCEDGLEGCACAAEGEPCEEGLACEEGRCVACRDELEGCPCELGVGCGGGLVCGDGGLCRASRGCGEAGCAPRQLCEEAVGADARCLEACMPGWRWDGAACVEDEAAANCQPEQEGSILADCQGLSRACEERGEGAQCGACVEGFVDEGGALATCRAALTCEGLGCAGLLRGCAEVTGADASCGGCLEGYAELEGRCVAAATCEAGAPRSILAMCEGQGRACVATGPQTAACAACLPGLIPADPEDMSAGCRAPLTCEALFCAPDETCFEGGAGQDARCGQRPCADPNQAMRRDNGQCVDCGALGASCGVTGESGELWLYTREGSDTCLCATQEGYYADVSGTAVARPCDRDGDGWVRLGAKGAINSADPTIRDNARCGLRDIDRFILQNEYQQRLEVFLCQGGPSVGGCAPGEEAPVALYESDRNDDPVRLANPNNANLAPAYAEGGVGRALAASELNPLTRACRSTLTDYNDNGVSDYAEHQRGALPPGQPAELAPFLGFAHFVELHRSWYEAPGEGEAYGAYVIAERSRCEEGFPLTYAEEEGPYWRQCARNRDAAWHIDPNEREPVGFDFAQWSCDEATGSCPAPAPPIPAMSTEEVLPHGLCEVDLGALAGEPWRGMGHHSQFKCALLDATQDPREPGRQLEQRYLHPDELYDGQRGAFTFNRCRVDCAEGDPRCAGDCDPASGRCEGSSEGSGEGPNPRWPRLRCEAVAQDGGLQSGALGFVAARYVDLEREGAPAQYLRGCLDEWRPGQTPQEDAAWRALCPGYLENPRGAIGQGNPNDFGQLLCGCGELYGGVGCAIGCPDALRGGPELNNPACFDGYCPVLPDDQGGGRRGVWLCGELSVTGQVDGDQLGPDLHGEGGARLRGGVSVSPVGRAAMCTEGGCDSGPSIR